VDLKFWSTFIGRGWRLFSCLAHAGPGVDGVDVFAEPSHEDLKANNNRNEDSKQRCALLGATRMSIP
jgi:hypothetical protein